MIYLGVPRLHKTKVKERLNADLLVVLLISKRLKISKVGGNAATL